MTSFVISIYNIPINNGKRDFIKRKTLIGDIDEGGINMICITSKLKSIRFKFFSDFYENFRSEEYHLGIQWLKFQVKDKLVNFNIIPSGDLNIIPPFYNSIFSSFQFVKKIDKENILDYKSNSNLSLKFIYKVIKKHFFVKPKIESQFLEFDDKWKFIYKNIHNKSINSTIRSFNYRFLFDALPTADKFGYNQSSCCFCNNTVESLKHIYTECLIIKQLISDSSYLYKDFDKCFNSYEGIRFLTKFSHFENVKICELKFIIWKMRDLCRINNGLKASKRVLHMLSEQYLK
jgi:hypothetical protein